MKKLLLIGVLALSLAFAGCGQEQVPEDPADNGQTVQEPDTPPADVSGEQDPTAADLGREETASLAVTMEGMTEEMPSTLCIRQGYSIYIPDEEWLLETDFNDDGAAWEDVWESAFNDDVKLGVRCYAGMTAEDAGALFVQDEDDYLFEDLTGGEPGSPLTGSDPEDNDMLAFLTAENDDAAYVVYWKYPLEAAEGFGLRLPVIAETFQLF